MARILITDDEPPVRQMMAEVASRLGHTAVEAKNAREALQLHQDTPADLIITDLVMRDMDGIELLRRIHANSPDTAVIGVSGHVRGKMYLNMARLVGADRVLAKPFSAEQLAEGITKALRPDRNRPAVDQERD